MASCFIYARCILVGIACLGVAFSTALADDDAWRPSPENVVVVANKAVRDSEIIARHYMQARGIPEANLIFIEASGQEEITWPDFIESVFNPLRRQLVERRWIDGVLEDETDSDGRLKGTFAGHKIDFLVTVYGVPLKTSGSSSLSTGKASDPIDRRASAVDSELSLLPVNAGEARDVVKNPLFARELVLGQQHHDLIMVSRLDGPDVKTVKALVDNALQGEANGLRGRAYIDTGGPFPTGDTWLNNTGSITRAMGFETEFESTKGRRFTAQQRFDAAALYFGWYGFKADGAFRSPDFRFPPGAIAVHLHSFSGYTVRTRNTWWVGPLVNRGVTFTLGNAYEPALALVHRYDFFMEALTRGKTVGEAAYFAQPALGWRTFLLGDPLYRPFAKDLEQQTQAALAPRKPSANAAIDPLQAYAVIRAMHRLARQGKNLEAIELGRTYLNAGQPNPLPVALTLKDLLKVEGQMSEVIERLEAFSRVERFPASLHPAAIECARFLLEQNRPAPAFAIVSAVINDTRLSDERALAWLPEAIRLAERTGASDTARTWKLRQETLKP
ncbi:MAG: TIGR03790 family protein [Opitutales bacterium]